MTSEGTFEVVNRLGLHARAASRLVQLASKFPCEIVLRREEQDSACIRAWLRRKA